MANRLGNPVCVDDPESEDEDDYDVCVDDPESEDEDDYGDEDWYWDDEDEDEEYYGL